MDNIDKLEKSLVAFEEKVIPILNLLKIGAKRLDSSIPKILNSWSGSWFGYQSKLYYGEFEKPPAQDRFSVEWGGINGYSDKWQERESEDVKKELEKISGISIDELDRKYKSLINIIEDFYDETSLVIKTDEEMQAEISKENLLEGQKKLKYGEEGIRYLKGRQPGTFMTRDTEALGEGILTPAILYYESLAKEIQGNVELVYKNIKSAHYFIRWMKTKKSSTKAKPVEAEPTSLYVKEGIAEAIKSKKDGFNYNKLLKLVTELNKNYLDSNPYSCLALIRAITDHIPPLLGYVTFEEVVNNYKGAKTDKNYINKLYEERDVSDDSLHRPISKSEDLIDMDDLPKKMLLNRLLQECIDNTVKEGFRHKKETKQQKKSLPIEPSLRPILQASITSLSGSSQGYVVNFDIKNAGKGLAILKGVMLGDVSVPIREATLGEGEQTKGSVNIEGSELRKGNIESPKLEIKYENIHKDKFQTAYEIKLEGRADGLFNIDSFVNPDFGI